MPRIFGDPRYPAHLIERAHTYAARGEEAYQILSAVPGIKINRAQGAFYMTALFEEGLLTAKQTLPVGDPELREIVERQAAGRLSTRASSTTSWRQQASASSPERLLLAASGLPLHAARDRRCETEMDPRDDGSGDHPVSEQLAPIGDGR